MDEIHLVLPGDPIPKGRPRHGRGHSFTPKRTRDAEQAIRDHALECGVTPFDVPVQVKITFYCRTRRRTDWDNLAKLATDALNGIAYSDDHLIHSCNVRLHRAAVGEAPRTEIRIAELS
jgi:crossover junction endodeoxyribonuclease RusA